MQIDIQGYGNIEIDTVILDLNGTIALSGTLVPGLKERIFELSTHFDSIVLFSGDTRGNAQKLADELGIEFIKVSGAEGKVQAAESYSADRCVAIGNGRIDAALFEKVALSIAVLDREGCAKDALLAADIVVPSVQNAFDILLDENSLKATLKL